MRGVLSGPIPHRKCSEVDRSYLYARLKFLQLGDIVMNETQIIEKAKEFATSEKTIRLRRKMEKVWKKHKEFLGLYPFRKDPRKIDELTPEKVYNPGKKEYFFIWVEHRLGDLGRVGSYGDRPWVNAKSNIDVLKELLKIAVDDSKSIAEKIGAEWGRIPRFGGDKTVAKKIVSLYYPEQIVPIFTTKHLEHFADELNIDFKSECMKKFGESYQSMSCGQAFELFNELLLKFKRSYDISKDWDNAFFMRFLYTVFPPPKKRLPSRKEPLSEGELGILLEKIKEGKISEERFIKAMKERSLEPILLEPLKNLGLSRDDFDDPYEQEVVFLFSKLHRDLGFPYIKEIRQAFPDAIALDENNEEKRIEFKVFASDFDYDPKGCDFIVCWENDLDKVQTEKLPKIISLKLFILKNLL